MAFIPATDLGIARAFYEGTLGLPVTGQTPFALVLDAGGTHLRVALASRFDPQPFTIAGWAVTDIHQSVRDLVARGVTFTRYEGMDQDPDGVWSTPDLSLIAWFTDPDGNTLSLTQFASA